MKSLYDYIVKSDNRYNNAVDVDGKELIINTEISERDAEYVNRLVTVIAKPVNGDFPFEIGDEVIIHHNVMRRWLDQRGKEKNGGGFLNEKEYAVSPDQIFAYKKDGEWRCPKRYCFVEPIVDESIWREERYEKLRGILTYTNDYFDELGITPGSEVGFTPESEYEFEIDGKLLYRIYSNDINILYGLQKTKRENNRILEESS